MHNRNSDIMLLLFSFVYTINVPITPPIGPIVILARFTPGALGVTEVE